MPPWPSSETVPHNLAAPLTSLIGRDREMADVASLLAHDRLVTLVGPAGIGKTRLAVHSAVNALADHQDGAWLIDLSLVTEPHLVIQSVASELGLRRDTGEPLLDVVTTFLAAKSVLLVLDNCEHLLHACAELACQLLPKCGNLRILATTREELGVVGEVVWSVPPLRSPRDESQIAVANSEAARLFLARSRAGTEVTEATAATFARICRRLDGIPLAIELAASRIGDLTLEEVETNLDHRFELLKTDRLGISERQRTLYAALDWSYNLIPEAEQALLRGVAVFAGPFTATSAADVCLPDCVDSDGVESIIARLAAKSLLVRQTDGVHIRFRMLESIRCFAHEKLHAAGEDRTLRASHARWCGALAARSDSGPVAERSESAARLADVLADLRAALAWSAEHDPELSLALAGDLTRFWVAHGHLEEGRTWLRNALEATPPASSARAKALWGSGLVGCLLGDFPAVVPPLEEGLALARQASDRRILARLLNLVGVTRIFTSPLSATDALEESVELARHHDETVTLVSSLALLGFARALCGDFDAAGTALEACLASGADPGESQPMVMGLVGLGHVRLHQGDPSGAKTLLGDGLAMARRLGNPLWTALALAYRAELESMLGDHAPARLLAAEAVTLSRATAACPVIGLCLEVAGTVELQSGNPSSSLPLFDEALSLCASGERGGVRTRALVGKGRAHLELGRAAEGQLLLEKAVKLAERERNGASAAAALHYLGRCAAAQDDHEAALGLQREALAAQSKAGHGLALPGTIEAIASEIADRGELAKGVRLVAATRSLRRRTGVPRSAENHADCESVHVQANETLRDEEREAAASAGAKLPTERLVSYASEGHGPRKRPPFGWTSLTPAELQVVELVAKRLTNAEVGHRLLIAPGTVKTHLSHVYRKLHLTSRRELTEHFIQRGL